MITIQPFSTISRYNLVSVRLDYCTIWQNSDSLNILAFEHLRVVIFLKYWQVYYYISLGYTLTICFTSGRVDCLHWEFLEPLCTTLFSMPRPLLTLWPHEDGIAISHMTWSTVQVMSVINELLVTWHGPCN